MSAEYDTFYNLVKRIEDDFLEIDGVIVKDLKETSSEYANLRQEILEMQHTYPVIIKLLEESSAMSISADEHEALLRYRELEQEIGCMERQQIYFRGHTDSFAYLKKIGAI
jgi:hypothetical protein